jgi:hypothetical protein
MKQIQITASSTTATTNDVLDEFKTLSLSRPTFLVYVRIEHDYEGYVNEILYKVVVPPNPTTDTHRTSKFVS